MARGSTATAAKQSEQASDGTTSGQTSDTQEVTSADVGNANAVAGEGTQAGTQTAAPKRTRNMPTYDLEVMDELPEESVGGRRRLYFDLLTKAAESPEKWVRIAHFQTPTGANNALREIKAQKREIPEGDWEFKAVKVVNPDNPAGQRHSQLFAKLVG